MRNCYEALYKCYAFIQRRYGISTPNMKILLYKFIVTQDGAYRTHFNTRCIVTFSPSQQLQ